MSVPTPSPDLAKNINGAPQVNKLKEDSSLGGTERQQSDTSASVTSSGVVDAPGSPCRKPRTRLQVQVAARRDSAVNEPLTPSTSSSSNESDIDEGKKIKFGLDHFLRY